MAHINVIIGAKKPASQGPWGQGREDPGAQGTGAKDLGPRMGDQGKPEGTHEGEGMRGASGEDPRGNPEGIHGGIPRVNQRKSGSTKTNLRANQAENKGEPGGDPGRTAGARQRTSGVCQGEPRRNPGRKTWREEPRRDT